MKTKIKAVAWLLIVCLCMPLLQVSAEEDVMPEPGITTFQTTDMRLPDGVEIRKIGASPIGGVTAGEDGLTIYEKGNEHAGILGSVEEGCSLIVTGKSADRKWYKVLYHGTIGYVKADNLTFHSSLYSSFLSAGEARVSSDSVKIRTGAGVLFSSNAEYVKGTRLILTGVKDNWYMVSMGNGIGYVWGGSVQFADLWNQETETESASWRVREHQSSSNVRVNPEYATLIKEYFLVKGFTEEGIAGILGNMYAESAVLPKNLENYFEGTLGYTDGTYTLAIDQRQYSAEQFAKDEAGYGLCQWTDPAVKYALYQMARSQKVSIGDISLQCDFLYNDLFMNHQDIFHILKGTKDVAEATLAFFYGYELPGIVTEYVEDLRIAYSLAFYEDETIDVG